MAVSAPQKLDHPRLLPAVLMPDRRPGDTRRSTRDWMVDIWLFAIAVLLGAVVFAEELRIGDPPGWLVVADVLAGVLACGALWVRRRWPVGVALALLLFSGFSAAAAVASLIAFFTVAVHRSFRTTAAVGALGLLVTPVYFELHPDPETPYAIALSLAVTLTLAAGAGGMFVRARRQLVLSLRDRAERAEALQREHAERARQQERARIAREMHDVLAHRISLLSMHAGSLEFRPDAPPAEIARAAGVVRSTAHQALQDLREVIGVLRDAPGDDDGPERPQPTLADLPALVAESRAAGVQVASELALDDLAEAPAAVGRNAYRIVQEGLTNARKHARGAAVSLAVAGGAGAGLTIEVRNRLPVGRAPAEIPGAGTGVIGLAERASLAGGRLEHGPTPAGEYRLWAWLPWPA